MTRRHILCMAMLLTLGLAHSFSSDEAKVGELAPDFWLKDQWEEFFKLSNLRGQVVLLVYGDRGGAQFNGNWAKAVREKYNSGGNERVKIVPIANLSAVPRPFRGYAKGKFQVVNEGTRARPVLLDWEGGVAKLYGFQEGVSNVYLINRDGVLRYKTSGKGLTGETNLMCETIDRVLGGK